MAWKLPLPAFSGSTPIIWDNLVFLNVATAAVDGADRALGRRSQQAGGHLEAPFRRGNRIGNKQNMSSPSPVTDGKLVWVMTGTGILKDFDFAGKELWTRDIQKDYGTFGIQFGYASSPLLDGDSLYVQVLHGMNTDDPSYVLRIDKMTGKTVWRVERPTDAQRRVAGLLHDAGAAAARRHDARSSSLAATSSRAMIRPPARKCGAPTSSIRATAPTTASSPRRSSPGA